MVILVIMTISIMMIISSGIQVIAAEGEHKASRALRHAAEVIADSPAALQVSKMIMVVMMVVVMVVVMVVLTTWVTIDLLPSAEVPANLEQHLGREQQHDRLPHPHRHHVPLHEEQWTTSTPSSAIGQYHHYNYHLHR